MANTQDIIKASLRLIGVIATGETPTDDELQDAREALNMMLGSWSAKRLLIPYRTAENFALVASTNSYTIATGGTFNTDRPVRIESGFIRDSNSNDTPIEIITRAQYNAHVLKTTEGLPYELFYEDTYPTGTVFLYYSPQQNYTLHINSWKKLTQLPLLTTEISMPDEYLRALKFNLAVEVAPEFGRSVPVEVAAIAKDSFETVSDLNRPDMLASADESLLYRGYNTNAYNIYTE